MRLIGRFMFKVFVGIFDHDDRRVDHRADGDGDAAETHDIGVNPLDVHDHEGDQDRHRQSDNRHQGAAHMEEKECGYNSYHDALFDKLFCQGFYGSFDQTAAVVNRRDRDSFRQARLQLLELQFDVFDRL